MNPLTEKDFKDVKGQLMHGFLSLKHLHGSLLAFLFVALFFVGISSFAVFMADTNIGWEGLGPFWQKVLLCSYSYMIIQLFLLFFIHRPNSFNHAIQLVGFLLSILKMIVDTFLILTVIFKDRFEYENLLNLLITLVVFVMVLSAAFVMESFIKRKRRDTEAGIFSTAYRHAYWLVPAVLITLLVFRNSLADALDAEGSAIFFASLFIMYGLGAALVLPVQGIYCYIKFPSFRYNENKAEIESEMLDTDEESIQLHILKADADRGERLENSEFYRALQEVFDYGSLDEFAEGVTINDFTVLEEEGEIVLLIVNRGERAIQSIRFHIEIKTRQDISLVNERVDLTKDQLGILGVGFAVPIRLGVEENKQSFIMDEYELKITHVNYE